MKNNLESKAGQLKNILLERIRSGEYPVGSKMPSIRELVKSENMCKSTVAQVLNILNDSGYIKLEHRKAAKVMKRPAKYRIGLFYMLSGVKYNFFWGEFVRGIRDEIKRHPDFELTELFNPRRGCSFDPSGLDGTLIMGSKGIKAIAPDGTEIKDHPSVYVYTCPAEGDFRGVTSDFSQAIQEYIRQMHLQGCRRIVLVRRVEDNKSSNSKLFWFRYAAEKYNIKATEINLTDTNTAKAEIYREFLRLFAEKESVDGIIVTSDQYALPVYRAAHECGKKIPDDLKVAGVDNLSDGVYMTPSLTSLELDRYRQGEAAVRLLIKRILDPEAQFEQMIFPAHPVYRESLAKK